MVSLGADRAGQRAARVLAGLEQVEHMAEVVDGLPAQFRAGALVHIDPVDVAEHPPPAPRVLRFGVGEQAAHHRGRVGTQRRQVGGDERRCRADDVAPETDRGRAVKREQVGIHHVLRYRHAGRGTRSP